MARIHRFIKFNPGANKLLESLVKSMYSEIKIHLKMYFYD